MNDNRELFVPKPKIQSWMTENRSEMKKKQQTTHPVANVKMYIFIWNKKFIFRCVVLIQLFIGFDFSWSSLQEISSFSLMYCIHSFDACLNTRPRYTGSLRNSRIAYRTPIYRLNLALFFCVFAFECCRCGFKRLLLIVNNYSFDSICFGWDFCTT